MRAYPSAPHAVRPRVCTAYFAELPEQMRPPISCPEKHSGQFDFEKEKLDMNDRRILIANDLFRLNTDKKEPAADQ